MKENLTEKVECHKCGYKTYNIWNVLWFLIWSCPKCWQIFWLSKKKHQMLLAKKFNEEKIQDSLKNTWEKINKTENTSETSQQKTQCPFCCEEIKAEAIKCKHCGEWLEKKNIFQETTPKNTTKKLDEATIEIRLALGASIIITIFSLVALFKNIGLSWPYTNILSIIYIIVLWALSYGIYKKSKICIIVFFALFLLEKLITYAFLHSFGFWSWLLLIFLFGGIRWIGKYRKLEWIKWVEAREIIVGIIGIFARTGSFLYGIYQQIPDNTIIQTPTNHQQECEKKIDPLGMLLDDTQECQKIIETCQKTYWLHSYWDWRKQNENSSSGFFVERWINWYFCYCEAWYSRKVWWTICVPK